MQHPVCGRASPYGSINFNENAVGVQPGRSFSEQSAKGRNRVNKDGVTVKERERKRKSSVLIGLKKQFA